SVNQDTLEFYADKYIDTSTCVLPESDFINTAIASIDFSGCGASYPTCMDSFDCKQSYYLMLQDMMPGEQYAKFTLSGGVFTVTDHLSILYTGASGLPKGIPTYSDTTFNFRHPFEAYKDENGVVDTVLLDNGLKYFPEQLSLPNFIHHFKPSWAKALVKYHPEYSYYEYCLATKKSQSFDTKLRSLGSFTEAAALGDTGYYLLLHQDPFFNNTTFGVSYIDSLLGVYRKQMYTKMHHYNDNNSILATAITMVVCRNGGSCTLDTSTGYNYLVSTYLNAACSRDEVWKNFLSLYLAAKQGYVQELRQRYAIVNGVYTECMSKKFKNLSKYGFDNECYHVNRTPHCTPAHYDAYGDSKQPCSSTTSGYYATKIPRFGSDADIPFNSLTASAHLLDSVHKYINDAQEDLYDSNCKSYIT
ncbi:MAG: hypothetical protein NTX03_00005, partial [Bacteroidetes bacterium]|nr:hypothetical protein [Bacteroidota bacterium]